MLSKTDSSSLIVDLIAATRRNIWRIRGIFEKKKKHSEIIVRYEQIVSNRLVDPFGARRTFTKAEKKKKSIFFWSTFRIVCQSIIQRREGRMAEGNAINGVPISLSICFLHTCRVYDGDPVGTPDKFPRFQLRGLSRLAMDDHDG